VGIYSFYGIYGIVQEIITTTPFGEEGDRFTYTAFLLFIQCVINAAFAYLALALSGVKSPTVPAKKFIPVAATYIAAMFCSNAALQYVDYPTQVLSKASKPIPVMVLGALVYRKYYPFRKWLSIFLISAGIAVFMFKQPKSHSVASGESDDDLYALAGYAFLVGSLIFDGLTGPAQEHLQTTYHPNFLYVMLHTNLWASVYMFVGVLITGQTAEALAFCSKHPEMVGYILLFGATSAMGQFFIYFTLHGFGSLVLTTVTTTRKFFLSMFASILWFGHSLNTQKWIGVALVFSGLGLDMLSRYLWDQNTTPVKTEEAKKER